MKLSFKKKLALDLFSHYRSVQSAIHDLTYLFWECTLRCNLSCLHCGSDCHKGSAVEDMPLEDFLRVLDRVAGVQKPGRVTIALTGGEPLLRADLEKCGIEFNRRGFPWGMVTNGYAMTSERFKRLLGAGMGSITVSVDGLKESHNWLRQNSSSFDKAMETASLAAGEKNVVFDVVTCVNQKNYSELDKLKQLLINNGVRKWRLFTIFPKGRAKDSPLLDVSNEQFLKLMQFIVDCRSEGKIEASFSCEGFLGDFEGRVREGLFFCRAGVNVGSVLIDGSISACPSLRGDYIQGNIYKEDFMDVWNSRFEIMRKRDWLKSGECSDCNVFKWCNGNGLHLREQKTGNLLRCHYKMLSETEG